MLRMQITAIILAGGKSKRMGTDKSLLEFNGETLLEHSVKICNPYFNPLLISSGNPEHQIPGCKLIPDIIPDCGPLGGLYSCLKNSETDWNFVLSVDAIFVEPAFISYMISEADDYDAVIPVHENGIEPLIGLYRKSSCRIFEEQVNTGNYKMHDLLEKLNVNYIDAQNWVNRYPYIFRNLNHREDFRPDWNN